VTVTDPDVDPMISRAPAAAFRRERLRFRAVCAWLSGDFRPATSLPATANPLSRSSFASPAPDSRDHLHRHQHRRRHVQQLGTADGAETMGGSSCGSHLSPGRGSAKTISDGCAYANRKVLVKGINENLLQRPNRGDVRPRALRWRLHTPERSNRSKPRRPTAHYSGASSNLHNSSARLSAVCRVLAWSSPKTRRERASVSSTRLRACSYSPSAYSTLARLIAMERVWR
jgi:hypothetical protein